MTINLEEFESFVRLETLKNAVSFGGKANPKAMLGKCIPKFPEMKQSMGEYVPKINAIVEKVNSLSQEAQKKELLLVEPNFFEEKKQKKEVPKKDGLPELPGCDGGVHVRFEPAPSGHLHLGHLFPLVANFALVEKFGGTFTLRIADTNPDNINLENYDKVIEDVNWVCDNKVDSIIYQSDRLPMYYQYLRTLFETNHVYVCDCDGDTFKAYTDSKEKCPHYDEPREIQKEKFEKFMKGELEGSVIRFKADVEHKNPAMRSFSLARINKNPHVRVGTKYSVWPTMQLAVAVDDVKNELTHIIRGKDHEINMERQKLIHQALGFTSPHYFHMGRMKFLDMNLSKSYLSEQIAQGVFSGWEDPRVPSILSHKKRGYKSQAFRKFILSLGISKRDSKITAEEYYKGLDYFNKQLLEQEANRAFFVHNSKTLSIENISEFPLEELTLEKHPDKQERGQRKFKVEKSYLIDSIDFNQLEQGDVFRLMHFGNFEVTQKKEDELQVKFISKEYDKSLKVKRNIHFVSSTQNEEIEVIMQDNSVLQGVVEPLGNLKEDIPLQFERFAFVKFDHTKENKKVFYYTHK